MADHRAETGTVEWLPVVGYEGYYEVSSAGEVRRIRPAFGAQLGRCLKQHPVKGYLQIRLCRHSRGLPLTVHRVVAAAFIGPRPDGTEVNHIDGDKHNNRPSNLEYVTRHENMQHAIRNGLRADVRGERCGTSKLKWSDAWEIRRLSESGMSGCSIARQFGIGSSTVYHILHGRSWLLREGRE